MAIVIVRGVRREVDFFTYHDWNGKGLRRKEWEGQMSFRRDEWVFPREMKKSFWREKASSEKKENLPRDKLVLPEKGNVTLEREKVFLEGTNLSRGIKLL